MAYWLDPSIVTGGTRKGGSEYSRGPVSGTAPARGGRTNQYAADCSACGKKVPKGMGSLERRNGTWVTTHLEKCA